MIVLFALQAFGTAPAPLDIPVVKTLSVSSICTAQYGNYGYLAGYTSFYMYDMTDPANPPNPWVTKTDLVTDATQIIVMDADTAYIASADSGDLPVRPGRMDKLTGLASQSPVQTTLTHATLRAAYATDTHIYIADEVDLTIYDATDFSKIDDVPSFLATENQRTMVLVSGNIVACHATGIVAYDIANKVVQTYPLSEPGCTALVVSEDRYIFVGAAKTAANLMSSTPHFDVFDWVSKSVVGTFSFDPAPSTLSAYIAVAVVTENLVVATWMEMFGKGGLVFINVEDKTNPTPVYTSEPANLNSGLLPLKATHLAFSGGFTVTKIIEIPAGIVPAPSAPSTAAPDTDAPATAEPTAIPTAIPTAEPTAVPTAVPTAIPTATPTAVPTAEPTAIPTAIPTAEPTAVPTAVPTAEPTQLPIGDTFAPPTLSPPTAVPTAIPTAVPTAAPTAEPTALPMGSTFAPPTPSPPTAVPTAVPTDEPVTPANTVTPRSPVPKTQSPELGVSHNVSLQQVAVIPEAQAEAFSGTTTATAAVAVGTTAALQVLAGAAAAPQGGGRLTRAQMYLKMLDCPHGAEADMDLLLSPTQLSIGRDSLRKLRGAAVGNPLLYASSALLLVVAAIIHCHFAVSASPSVLTSLSHTPVPVWFMVVDLLWSPTVQAATALILSDVGGWRVYGGVLAALLALFVMGLLMMIRKARSKCKTVVLVTISGPVSFLRHFFSETAMWEANDAGSEESIRWMTCLFEGFKREHCGFYIVQLVCTAAVGMLAAWDPQDSVSCSGRAAILMGIPLVWTGVLLKDLPFIRPVENVAELVMSTLEFAFGVMGFRALSNEDPEMLEQAGYMATVIGYVAMAKMVLDLCLYIYSLCAKGTSEKVVSFDSESLGTDTGACEPLTSSLRVTFDHVAHSSGVDNPTTSDTASVARLSAELVASEREKRDALERLKAMQAERDRAARELDAVKMKYRDVCRDDLVYL